MSFAALLPVERFARTLAVLLAVLGLLGNAASGGFMALPNAVSADARALGVICHAPHADDGTTAPGQGDPARGHPSDCTLCGLCLAAAVPAALPAPGPTVPTPRGWRTLRGMVAPPARAPPPPVLTAAWPRGPPRMI